MGETQWNPSHCIEKDGLRFAPPILHSELYLPRTSYPAQTPAAAGMGHLYRSKAGGGACRMIRPPSGIASHGMDMCTPVEPNSRLAAESYGHIPLPRVYPARASYHLAIERH